MSKKQDFYDSYHEKNDKFYGIIKRNNFTYYEIIKFFYSYILVNLFEVSIKSNNKANIPRILDVGCGVGTLALFFASLGMKVKGVDISSRAIQIAENARKQMNYKNISFAKQLLQKGKGQYDMVLISEVIEHIENEKEFLEKIHSHLTKNGLLFLTTPLKTNLLYKVGFYKSFDKEVGHLRRYTKESIQELLDRNNFSVLHFREVEGPLRNLLFTTKLGFLIKFIRGPLIPLFHKIDWISIKLFGASDILVVARRKTTL